MLNFISNYREFVSSAKSFYRNTQLWALSNIITCNEHPAGIIQYELCDFISLW